MQPETSPQTTEEMEFIPNVESLLSPAARSSTSPSSTDHENLIQEKDAEILFLKRTNDGLHDEIQALQDYANLCNSAHLELVKVYGDLQKSNAKMQMDAEKDNSNLSCTINEMRLKLDELSASKGKFIQHQEKSRKPYHKLCPAQKSAVHKDLRENLVPDLDTALKKRKLYVDSVILAHTEGEQSSVKIDIRPKRTFSQLSPIELETVAAMSDSNSIYRTSHAAYASKRRLIKDLPPLSHLKSYDESLKETLPKITVAPGRAGGFTPIRTEVKKQIEYLDRKGDLDLNEPVYVKTGIDATKMTNQDSACIYTVESISSKTEIGLVGAVKGGDSADDMEQCGKPYFEQLKELDINPLVETNAGVVKVELRGGGDLSNLYAQLGLCKATSKHPCPICVLPKDSFYATAFDPQLVQKCNGRQYGRTRANISNEAIKSKPGYSVKRLPQCPLPRDPNKLIIEWVIYCVLHADMRLAGKNNGIKGE